MYAFIACYFETVIVNVNCMDIDCYFIWTVTLIIVNELVWIYATYLTTNKSSSFVFNTVQEHVSSDYITKLILECNQILHLFAVGVKESMKWYTRVWSTNSTKIWILNCWKTSHLLISVQLWKVVWISRYQIPKFLIPKPKTIVVKAGIWFLFGWEEMAYWLPGSQSSSVQQCESQFHNFHALFGSVPFPHYTNSPNSISALDSWNYSCGE